MGRIAVFSTVLAIAAAAGTARADDVTEAPELPRKRGLSQRVLDNLTLISNDVALHLNAMTFDLMEMEFDLRKRLARVRIGGGSSERLRLVLDGDIHFEKGYARIDAALQLAVAGRELKLELPEFDMVPRSMEGERWVEWRFPLLRGEF